MLRKFFKHPFLLPRLLVWGMMFMPIFFILNLFIPAYFSAKKRFESIYADFSHAPHLPIKVLAADGKLLGEIWAEGKCAEISYEALPKALVETIVLEYDSLFWTNDGINIPSFSLQGSIAQSIARNATRSIGRRRGNFLIETYFWLPLMFEKSFTKEEIFTIYCNELFWDWDSKGIENPSQGYFRKTISEINLQEIAFLVGMSKKPSGKRDTSQALAMRNKELDRMAEHNIYPSAWKDSLKSLPLGVYPPKPENGMRTYLKDAVHEYLKEWQKTHYQENIYEAGLQIYTTIDSNMQVIAEANVLKMMPKIQMDFEKNSIGKKERKYDSLEIVEDMKRSNFWHKRLEYGRSEKELAKAIFEKREVRLFTWEGEIDTLMSPWEERQYYKKMQEIGFCAISPKTGQIKAYIGGIDKRFFPKDNIQSLKQIGSAVKPFFYGFALETDIYPCKVHPAGLNKGMEYSMGTAPPYFKIDGHATREYYQRFGFYSPLDTANTLKIGMFDLSLMELIAAYAVFANKGTYIQPTLISHITDKSGNRFEMPVVSWQATSVPIAEGLLGALKNIAMEDYGTGMSLATKYGLKGDIACKTGNTSTSRPTAWFTGICPDLVTTVWVGCDDRNRVWNKTGSQNAMLVVGQWLKNLQQANILLPQNFEKYEGKLPNMECNPNIASPKINTEGWE